MCSGIFSILSSARASQELNVFRFGLLHRIPKIEGEQETDTAVYQYEDPTLYIPADDEENGTAQNITTRSPRVIESSPTTNGKNNAVRIQNELSSSRHYLDPPISNTNPENVL